MSEVKNLWVFMRCLLDGPLGESGARLVGYAFVGEQHRAVHEKRHNTLDDMHAVLVDGDLHARIESAGEQGLVVPTSLPCVFLSRMNTRVVGATWPLREGEVVCEALMTGTIDSCRQFLGHALFINQKAVIDFHTFFAINHGQIPSANDLSTCGGVYRVRPDDAAMTVLRGKKGPWFPEEDAAPAGELTLPFPIAW